MKRWLPWLLASVAGYASVDFYNWCNQYRMCRVTELSRLPLILVFIAFALIGLPTKKGQS